MACRSGLGSCACYVGSPTPPGLESTADWIARNSRVIGRGWFVLIWRIDPIFDPERTGAPSAFYVRKPTGSADPDSDGVGGMNIFQPGSEDVQMNLNGNHPLGVLPFKAFGDSVARFWFNDDTRGLAAPEQPTCKVRAEVLSQPIIEGIGAADIAKAIMHLDWGDPAGEPTRNQIVFGDQAMVVLERTDALLYSNFYGQPGPAHFRAWPYVTTGVARAGTLTLRVWYEGPIGSTVPP